VNAPQLAKDLIAQLDLSPHPEGGWYREVHRSAQILTLPHGPRAALTSIYYLLEAGQLSRWHLVNSDEIWHLHAGAPLELLTYQPADKNFSRKVLGPPAEGQERFRAVGRSTDVDAGRRPRNAGGHPGCRGQRLAAFDTGPQSMGASSGRSRGTSVAVGAPRCTHTRGG